jgi:arylsulfatase A-like enzyme
MPARRDIMTGRLNFLEREWGGLEPFDIPFPKLLREEGIYTRMETDHYHYVHVGGENYHTPFDSWNLYRGQEFDTYAGQIRTPAEPPHLGRWNAQYTKNRATFDTESDFSTPKTFSGAIEWLKINQGADDFFLWLEAFDPHEPFDCPEKYLEMYRDEWEGPLYNWSGYETVDGQSDASHHLQHRYAATLTMMDRWFGKLLDELERQKILDDCLIVFTTDHGHLLGEHDYAGKNFCHFWNELAHIPLIVHLPGDRYAGEKRHQLTQNIDIMPTIMDYFDIPFHNPVHGQSLRSILEDNAPSKRETALYGCFGQTVNCTDGQFTYFRTPCNEDNQPLFRYFLTPSSFNFHDHNGIDFYNQAELGQHLPYTDFPVIKANTHKPRAELYDYNGLYNLEADYHQQSNLAGTAKEKEYIDKLKAAMRESDAPSWQYQRLGL